MESYATRDHECPKHIPALDGEVHERLKFVQSTSFFDDLIVFSKTLEEHELWLTNVLDRLRE